MTEQAPSVVSEARRGPSFHNGVKAEWGVPRILKAWIDSNLPPPKRGSGRRRAMLEMFGNRVTRKAIRHWCQGKRKPPQWVLEVMEHGARNDVAERLHVASLLRAELEKRNTKP